MDWVEARGKWTDLVKKYRYVLLVVLAGIFLMALPEGKKTETVPQTQTPTEESAPDLQESLSEILSMIEGAGKVKVLLTQSEGEKTVYQTDEDITTGDTSGDVRRDTVILSDSNRGESALIKQVNPPVYLGAVVLCQGADKASIRLSIVEAVAKATGLTTDKITVLKMK